MLPAANESEATAYVIRIVCDSLGRHGAHSNCYVSFFDPDRYGGRGLIRSVPDPRKAMIFPGRMEAHELWTLQSRTVPLRDDGRFNRPLTAYTVEILPLHTAVAAFLAGVSPTAPGIDDLAVEISRAKAAKL